MYRLNKTLVYFLILTIVGSALTYKIVVEAYENAYADYYIE